MFRYQIVTSLRAVSSMPDEIAAEVAAGLKTYSFFTDSLDGTLVRQEGPNGRSDRLLDDAWVPRTFRWQPPDARRWKRLKRRELRSHVRRNMVSSLTSEALSWRSQPIGRLRRSILGRLILPSFRGGSARHPTLSGTFTRSRISLVRALRRTKGDDLIQLEGQALRGLEEARNRVARADQRANFFLGAAGLTTSLVLANGTFLIGEDKLDHPWRGIAVGVLIFASVCALVAGVRALQASMLTNQRMTPENLGLMLNRSKKRGDAMRRDYVAAVLVTQARSSSVGSWKLSLVASSRRWFTGVIFGVVALTICVLFGAAL